MTTKECRKQCELAMLIAKDHLEQPDELVDNKPYWQQLYNTNKNKLKTLLLEEMCQKYF